MGDVAMAVPVVKQVLQQHPDLQVSFVSNAFLRPLFDGLERCRFYGARLKETHKGIPGITRLFNELSSLGPFDAVIDLHSVLRSHLLCSLFRLKKVPCFVVDKGRSEKKALTRKVNKDCRQLKSTHERYADVFRKAGLNVQLTEGEKVYQRKGVPLALESVFSAGKKIIGVAPFAQYKEKTFPPERTKKLVEQLAGSNATVLLFGGGKEEAAILKQWEMDIFGAFNMAGRYSFEDELAVISNLDGMLSMDSANMHLASLFDVPVVSIWGATHHFAGFQGWGQGKKNMVEISLYCRPCSVFGNKPCYRGDHACMHWIDQEQVWSRLEDLVRSGKQ